MADVTKALKDSAYVALGFGLIGWNRVQVRRRELTHRLSSQRLQAGTQLDEAREQVAALVKTLDSRLQPVRQELELNLDRVTERLPGQARDVVQTARSIARETEQQVRKAVGG